MKKLAYRICHCDGITHFCLFAASATADEQPSTHAIEETPVYFGEIKLAKELSVVTIA